MLVLDRATVDAVRNVVAAGHRELAYSLIWDKAGGVLGIKTCAAIADLVNMPGQSWTCGRVLVQLY